MTSPDRPELRGKPNPAEILDLDFQRGLETGKVAAEPSTVVVFRLQVAETRAETLSQKGVRFPKLPEITVRGDFGARQYIDGYIFGLGDFLSEHEFNINPPMGLVSPIILRGLHALDGYVDGLGRKHPRLYGLYDKLTQKGKPSQAEYEEEERRSGYILGFAVGLAKDFGIRANLADVPEDTETFVAFNLGINGDTRQPRQPIYREVSGRKYQDFYDQQRELKNQRAYELGLLVWLKQQGIEGIEVWEIRDPDVFGGFKTSLAGKTIPEFEVPQKSWWRLSPLGIALKDSLAYSRGEKINMRNRIDNEKQLRKTPTIPQIRQVNRERGYRLGQEARKQRLAREQAVPEQQASSQ